MPSLNIKEEKKHKVSYFLKRNPVEVTIDNFRDVIIMGDMSPKPIQELAILTEEVKFLIFYQSFKLFNYCKMY